MPDVKDILYSRQGTIGIHEYDFETAEANLQIIDVGGTRSQRNKWLQVFEGCNAFIFLTSIGNYEKKMEEDESTFRIMDSLALFEAIINNVYLENMPIILFLQVYI